MGKCPMARDRLFLLCILVDILFCDLQQSIPLSVCSGRNIDWVVLFRVSWGLRIGSGRGGGKMGMVGGDRGFGLWFRRGGGCSGVVKCGEVDGWRGCDVVSWACA